MIGRLPRPRYFLGTLRRPQHSATATVVARIVYARRMIGGRSSGHDESTSSRSTKEHPMSVRHLPAAVAAAILAGFALAAPAAAQVSVESAAATGMTSGRIGPSL